MTEFRAVSPTGSPIIGTLERISGVAEISEFSWSWGDDGRLDFEHSGYTEVDWDSETTATYGATSLRVFVDEAGEEWAEDQIRLVAVEP